MKRACAIGLVLAAGCLALPGSCADDEPAMVHGRLAESAGIERLHPRFRAAFEFLRTNDLSRLSLGRHEIDGTNVYANVIDSTLKPWNPTAQLEVHRRFIDIHVPVSGVEAIGHIRDEASVRRNDALFNVEKDYVLFTNPAMRQLLVSPGEFAVFFPPLGAHAPGLTAGDSRVIRKVVVKVRR